MATCPIAWAPRSRRSVLRPSPSPPCSSRSAWASPFSSATSSAGSAEEPHSETPEEARTRRHEQLMLGGVGVAAAIVVGLVGRDLSARSDASDVPGQARLIHLFTYNYRRPWPETLDWSGLLAAFGVVCAGLCLFLMI